MFADGLQHFPSQLLFRIEEEAESRNDIEGVAERLPCYVDLLQSDVVRTEGAEASMSADTSTPRTSAK